MELPEPKKKSVNKTSVKEQPPEEKKPKIEKTIPVRVGAERCIKTAA